MTKKKRLSPSEWLLKQSKRHKRKNTLYTAIVLLVALVLLIFAVNSIKVEPVKSDTRDKDSIRLTYLGNVTLNKHIRQTNLNDVFKGIQDTLDHSDFSTGSLIVNDFSKNQKDNINKNIENIMFLRKHNVKSVNLINESMDNIQATAMMRKIDSQAGYNFLTGNGSNPINSKTVQQDIKGKKIANVSFTDIESNYTNSLKNTTSISLDPDIFYPLIKKLKENNDYVVVNVDWGIPNERNVTTRQKEYAHALANAGADVIIGHNTVIQKVENYKRTPIFYSLGNTTSDNFLSKNQKGMIVQQDWKGSHNQFHITPIQSKDGKISKDNMNKMDHIRFKNNIKDKSIDLKSDQNGGYTFEY